MNSFFHNHLRPKFGFAMMTLGSLLILCSGVLAQESDQTDDSLLELERAKGNVEFAISEYKRVKRLHDLGSATSRELRLADYNRKSAGLELFSIQEPENREELQLLLAKLTLEWQTTEFQIADRLFEKGAISRLRYRRAKARFEIAKLNVEFRESETATQKKLVAFRIATVRFKLAEEEYEITQRLWNNGSVNNSTRQQFEKNLDLAKTELSARKTDLGAYVIQIKTTDSTDTDGQTQKPSFEGK